MHAALSLYELTYVSALLSLKNSASLKTWLTVSNLMEWALNPLFKKWLIIPLTFVLLLHMNPYYNSVLEILSLDEFDACFSLLVVYITPSSTMNAIQQEYSFQLNTS